MRVSGHESVCIQQSWGTCCIYLRKGIQASNCLPAEDDIVHYHSFQLQSKFVCACMSGMRGCGCVMSQGWMLFLTLCGPDSEGAVWVRLRVSPDQTWVLVTKVVNMAWEHQMTSTATKRKRIKHETWINIITNLMLNKSLSLHCTNKKKL